MDFLDKIVHKSRTNNFKKKMWQPFLDKIVLKLMIYFSSRKFEAMGDFKLFEAS